MLQASMLRAEELWPKHIVHRGRTMTAVAADFTGDGLVDVISDGGGKTRLFVAPQWTEHVIDDHPNISHYIHSEFFDVDEDGDLDYMERGITQASLYGWKIRVTSMAFGNPELRTTVCMAFTVYLRLMWTVTAGWISLLPVHNPNLPIPNRLSGCVCLTRHSICRDGKFFLLL